MALAAFTGSYADIKLIRSRSVMQIIVEVPIEQAEAVIAAFGVPQPGAERPVAVALLNTSGPSEATGSSAADLRPAVVRPPEPQASGKADGQPAAPDRLVQRVAILCGEPDFQWWLRSQGGTLSRHDEDTPQSLTTWTVQRVRQICGVASRRELSTNPAARQRAEALLLRYDQTTGRAAKDWRQA